ncbi:unnamed protein product [Symbiodinium sp. CCMP2592]|nr:unnamed protein product [Symbiodinium sp. CCMP2592]
MERRSLYIATFQGDFLFYTSFRVPFSIVQTSPAWRLFTVLSPQPLGQAGPGTAMYQLDRADLELAQFMEFCVTCSNWAFVLSCGVLCSSILPAAGQMLVARLGRENPDASSLELAVEKILLKMLLHLPAASQIVLLYRWHTELRIFESQARSIHLGVSPSYSETREQGDTYLDYWCLWFGIVFLGLLCGILPAALVLWPSLIYQNTISPEGLHMFGTSWSMAAFHTFTAAALQYIGMRGGFWAHAVAFTRACWLHMAMMKYRKTGRLEDDLAFPKVIQCVHHIDPDFAALFQLQELLQLASDYGDNVVWNDDAERDKGWSRRLKSWLSEGEAGQSATELADMAPERGDVT